MPPRDRSNDPAAQARAELDRAMRVMFERWGAWRVAPPEDAARLKLEIAQAEAEFLRAREALERMHREAPTLDRPPAAAPIVDLARLRATVQATTVVLAQAKLSAWDVDELLSGRRLRDTSGELLAGLEDATWRHSVSRGRTDVWALVDGAGRTLAKITHAPGDEAEWTCATWSEATGELS